MASTMHIDWKHKEKISNRVAGIGESHEWATSAWDGGTQDTGETSSRGSWCPMSNSADGKSYLQVMMGAAYFWRHELRMVV